MDLPYILLFLTIFVAILVVLISKIRNKPLSKIE